MTPSASQAAIQAAVCSFLATLFPQLVVGQTIVEGFDNLVGIPSQANYISIAFILRHPISTNLNVWADCVIEGSISGDILTSTSVTGVFAVGSTLWGAGVPSGVTLTAQPSPGVFTLSAPLSLGLQQFACGNIQVIQPMQMTCQCDIFSAAVADAGDMAHTLATMWRDGWACDFFQGLGAPLTPLYANDPRFMAFENEEQNWEARWIVEAVLQTNLIVNAPMQFFDNIVVTFNVAD